MGHIRYEVRDRVATITIDRPEKRNAMTFAILDEFEDAIRRAGSDDAAGAVVVTGAGGAFCAGTDLVDLAGT
ncbi:MAG: enoyl-CoA hydratase/isomerase family protein, partial [Acidimicrobiales bacterium]